MKLFCVFINGLVLANAIAAPQWLRRDVNEYLSAVEIPEKYFLAEKFPDSATLSEYYRKRRDVSHLDLAYLPPATPKIKQYLPALNAKDYETIKQLPTLPSMEYLPPVSDVINSQDVTETPQPATTTAFIEPEVETEPSHPVAEYLSPAAEYLPPATAYLPPPAAIATKSPQSSSNGYLPPVTSGANISQLPQKILPKTNEDNEIKANVRPVQQTPAESSGEIVKAPIEIPRSSAVLDVDGYHYKTPDIKPDLFSSIMPPKKYLPTLEDGVVEARGPANGDSAALGDNGYHYRTIKRHF